MPEYLSPGVYVEEVDRGPKPIEGVGTAMACFVGFTEKASSSQRIDGETVIRDLAGQPVLVTNWSQYVETFGGFVDGARMPMAVYGYFQNGGSRCYCLSVKTIPRAQAILLNAKPHGQCRPCVTRLNNMRQGLLRLRGCGNHRRSDRHENNQHHHLSHGTILTVRNW